MFDVNKVAADFSRSASKYDMHATLQRQVLKNLLEKIRPSLSASAKILDAGCGTGQLGRLLPDAKVTQLDIAIGMCNMAVRSGHATVNGTIGQMPFPENQFDIVFSSLALQWLPEQTIALNNLRQVVKPGGMLAVSSLGPATLKELRHCFIENGIAHAVSDFKPLHVNAFQEIITEYYSDVNGLMLHLKTIGAHNKKSNRFRGMMTKAKISRIQELYLHKFGSQGQLPVTWEINYLLERK